MAKLYVRDLEDLIDEEDGINGLSEVGVEIIDKDTKELKDSFVANSAWINKERDELTITIEV